MKTPEPIIEPITRVVESTRPRPLTRPLSRVVAIVPSVPAEIGPSAASGSRPAMTATESAPALQNIESIFVRDAADRDQRLFEQRAAAADLFDADHGVGIALGGGARRPGRARRNPRARRRRRRAAATLWLEKPMTASAPIRRARVARRQIVLADVQAGLEQHGEIGAVVDDRGRAGFAAQARDAFAPIRRSRGSSGACGGSAGCPRRHREMRRRRFPAEMPRAVERFRVENRVDPGQPHEEDYRAGGRCLRSHAFAIRLRARHSALRETDHAIGTDAVHRALHDQAVGVIQRGDLLALVDQQRKGKLVLRSGISRGFPASAD